MRTPYFIIVTFSFLTSCLTAKEINQDDCQTILYHADRPNEDTTKIKLLQTVYFDTTAVFLHGHVIDQMNKKPIPRAFITMYNGQTQYKDTTDEKGEFEIFKNISEGQWHLKIVSLNYECLIIKDILHAGGQWFNFKLKHN